MSESFLAYIVRNHGLTFEDAATDALAFVLENSSGARDSLRSFLNTGAQLLPDVISIETRRSTGNYGVPDLVIKDVDGKARVIIESKFTAGLTGHQPVGYLKYLDENCPLEAGAMLIFVVPESRVGYYFAKISGKVKSEIGPFADKTCLCQINANTQKAHRLCVLVTTWTKILSILKTGDGNASSYFDLFLSDLERMCKVAEPDQFEAITDTELQELQNKENHFATRARNFMALANTIAGRTLDSREDWSKYDSAWAGCGAAYMEDWGSSEFGSGWTLRLGQKMGKAPSGLKLRNNLTFPKSNHACLP
jgi:hypothetical protein